MRLTSTGSDATITVGRIGGQGNQLTLSCTLESGFAQASLPEVEVELVRAQAFADRIAAFPVETCVLQSTRPGELVIALAEIPDSSDLVAKATLTRLKEIGEIKASDMLTISFAISRDELPRILEEARALCGA